MPEVEVQRRESQAGRAAQTGADGSSASSKDGLQVAVGIEAVQVAVGVNGEHRVGKRAALEALRRWGQAGKLNAQAAENVRAAEGADCVPETGIADAEQLTVDEGQAASTAGAPPDYSPNVGNEVSVIGIDLIERRLISPAAIAPDR